MYLLIIPLVGYSQRVKKREERIRNHETVVENLHQQIKTLKQEIKTLMEYRLETENLRNKVENLQAELDSYERWTTILRYCDKFISETKTCIFEFASIKKIIRGSAAEASEQLSLMRNKDPVALSSCIRSLKK